MISETFRVLRPGGRVGVSDVVAEDRLAPADRAVRGSYVGCVAGALSVGEYETLAAGRRLRRDQRDVHPRGRRRDARRDRQGGPPRVSEPARIGINGFGRMGRLALRAGWGRHDLSFVHVNELQGDAETCAHLLEFDSVHGRWAHQIAPLGGALEVDGRPLSSAGAPSPATCPGRELGVDLVLECSGRFRTPETLAPYFERGVSKVVVAAPVKAAAP